MSNPSSETARTVADLICNLTGISSSPFVYEASSLYRPSTNIPASKIPIDMVNDDNTIYIYAELPGVNNDNLDIDCYNNKLTISAERTKAYENTEISELKSGKFQRVITLPICVTKKETVSVSLNNGILKIKINKLSEEANKFSLKVNNNSEN